MVVDGVKIERVGRVTVERLGHHLDVAIEPLGLVASAGPWIIVGGAMIVAPIVMFASASDPPGNLAMAVVALAVGAGTTPR